MTEPAEVIVSCGDCGWSAAGRKGDIVAVTKKVTGGMDLCVDHELVSLYEPVPTPYEQVYGVGFTQTPAWACNRCGALVRDRGVHDTWHENLRTEEIR